MLVATSELTSAEKLIIQRRRDGSTLPEAAKKRKVSVTVYRGWEQGGEGAPSVAVGKLSDQEQCVVKRLRAGISVRELAKRMKLSRWWVRQMETGAVPVDGLRDYWSKK